jgi:signal transduction histidine kinase
MFNWLKPHKKDEVSRGQDLDRLIRRLEIVTSVSASMVSNTDLDETLQFSVNLVVEKLGYYGAVIYIPNQSLTKLYSKTVSQTWYVKAALNVIPVPFDKLNVDIDNDSKNYIVRTFKTGEVNEDDDLKNYVVPAVTSRVSDTIQFITGTKKIVSLPIQYKDELKGVIMFTKNSAESFNNDITILKTFTEQLSIAIQNANLFKEITNQVDALTIKNKDLQSLYELTSNVSKSLDPDIVAQTAVDSLPQDETMVGAILTKYDEKNRLLYPQAVTQNSLSNEVKRLLGGDFSKFPVRLDDPLQQYNLTTQAFKNGQIYNSSDLADLLSPPIPKTLVKPIASILNIKSVVVYPIVSRGVTVGTIAYFLKSKNYDELLDNEKQLYATYTYQIAIALENASLFKLQQETQRNLETSKGQIEEAYRKEKDMMDILGHELRTPLTIVRNAILMIDKEYEKPDPKEDLVRDLLGKAKENIRREISTLQTVLSTTRLENDRVQINYTKVDAKDVINDSLDALRAEAEKKKLEIKVNMPEGEVFVWAGREQTQEIVDNLLSNAIKYTPQGTVEITLAQEGNLMRFTVKDSGEGIPENELPNLGKKFHRINTYIQSSTNDSYKIVRPGGTGIGLYVVTGFLKVMGGRLDVQSKLGEGSTFSAFLPKYDDQDKLDNKTPDIGK